jgi:ABC-type dipeptide/oligopeptide/nickel transport system ATPase subunit
MSGALPLLDVSDLTVEFSTRRGVVRAVTHINIGVGKGETVGIVGESGSGKSVTSYAVMRILDRAGRIAQGAVHFSGIDLIAATEDEMRNLRGREISMVFQNPRAALNPIRKVGHQIEDVLWQHSQVDSSALTDKTIEMLDQVRIARPRERYHAYPFELSGGMCQRVVIALALACRPRLLIADEPTTGLDVTTQKAVMDLMVGDLLRPGGGHGAGQRGGDRAVADDLHGAGASLYPQADALDTASGHFAARPAAGRRAGRFPSPLWGGVRGGGREIAAGGCDAGHPPPQRSPTRGEGAHAAPRGGEAGEGISA